MTHDEIVRALHRLSVLLVTPDSIVCCEAADLIESMQAQLADYHHMSELVNGKMEENQRLRRINENLQEQLAAFRRREQAAVEDLKRFSACCQCNANIDGSCCDMFDGTAENKYFCSNWQWRGSQEAEEGGTQ